MSQEELKESETESSNKDQDWEEVKYNGSAKSFQAENSLKHISGNGKVNYYKCTQKDCTFKAKIEKNKNLTFYFIGNHKHDSPALQYFSQIIF